VNPLDTLTALASKATPYEPGNGPMQANGTQVIWPASGPVQPDGGRSCPILNLNTPDDAAYIAAASPDAILAIAAYVTALREALERIRDLPHHDSRQADHDLHEAQKIAVAALRAAAYNAESPEGEPG